MPTLETISRRMSMGFSSISGSALDEFEMKETAAKSETQVEGFSLSHKDPTSSEKTTSHKLFKILCSLRVTTQLTLVASFLVMMAVFLAVLLTVFKISFNRMEVSNTRDATQRVTRAMYDDLNGQVNAMSDYGNWDTTFLTVRDYTPEAMDEYLRINFYYEYVRDVHQSNYCIMYFLNGTLAGWVGYDLQTGAELPMLEEFQQIPLDHPLMQNVTKDVNARQGGFYINSKNELMIVTTFPIQSIFYSEYPVGVMLYARYPGRGYTMDLSIRSQMCVTVYDRNQIESPALSSRSNAINNVDGTLVLPNDPDWVNNRAFQVTPFMASSEAVVAGRECWRQESGNTTSKEQRMATYQVFKDIYGQNAVIVRADIPRYINQLGNRSFGWAYGLVALVALVMSASIVLLVEFCVLSPVLRLGNGVNDIAESNGLSQRIPVKSRNEIGTLTRRVNSMLNALDLSQKKLEEEHKKLQSLIEKISIEEHKSRTITNSIHDYIISVNAQSGLIMNANTSFYAKLKYAPKETENLVHIQAFFKAYEKHELMDQFVALANSGSFVDAVLSAKFTDIPVQLSASRVRLYQGDQLVDAFVVVARNMSEQKQLQESLQANAEQLRSMEAQLEFDFTLRNPELRSQFKEWCKMEQSEENINFLEVIDEYRQLKHAHERVLKQQHIVEQYLLPDSPYLLNLAHNILENERFQLEKSVGQVDVFDTLETTVRVLIVSDTFSRFFSHMQGEKKVRHRKKQSTEAEPDVVQQLSRESVINSVNKMSE